MITVLVVYFSVFAGRGGFGLGGNEYYMLLIEYDISRYSAVYFMRSKNEVFKYLSET